MQKILSLSHPLVKHCVKLRDDRHYRTEQRHVLISGHKMIEEVCAHHPTRTLFISEELAHHSFPPVQNRYLVTEAVLKKITGLPAPEGVAAEVAFPAEPELSQVRYALACDGLSDPGNLGTLMRTALALGWEALYLLPNCVDPFNDKALRAAKGASFRLPFKTLSLEALCQIAHEQKLQLIGAALTGASPSTFDPEQAKILIVGQESTGLSPAVQAVCERVSIPMSNRMESLNAAVAGAILMYLLKPNGQ